MFYSYLIDQTTQFIRYGFVLDSLLFPPHVKEQLMQSQTKEKKMMIINMHKHLLQNKKGEYTLFKTIFSIKYYIIFHNIRHVLV